MADFVRPVLPKQATSFNIVSARMDVNPAQQTVLRDLVLSAPRGVVIVHPILVKCKVSVLCVATAHTVVILKNVRAATHAWRVCLQDTILCNVKVRVVGLDFNTVAYGLFSELHCHTSRGIDIQSLFSSKTRDASSIMEELLAGKAPRGAASRLFNSGRRNVDAESLAVARSYVLAHTMLSEKCISKILAVGDQHLMSTRRVSVQVLMVLSKIHRVGMQLDAMKPIVQQNDIERAQRNSDGGFTLQSQRYKTRLRDNGQRIVIKNRDGSEASGRISEVNGRQGVIRLRKGSTSTNAIASVFTVGKEAPTNAEKGRQDVLLEVLQGRVNLQNNLAFCKIWVMAGTALRAPARVLQPVLAISPAITLNKSQLLAVRTAASPLPVTPGVDVQLIHGPPGTGKTSVISAIVQVVSTHRPTSPGIWLVAQSNVAVKNIAQKLAEHKFWDFVVLVSHEFHFDWHEHLYDRIQQNVIVSDNFADGVVQTEQLLAGRRVVLCTMSMLSNRRMRTTGFTRIIPIEVLIVDEASQIEIGDYLAPAHAYAATLKRVIFVGDDKQLAPYGQDDIAEMESIFELPAHRSGAILLDTSYRMPTRICDFISRHVYANMLKSHHSISSASACKFVDVTAGKEKAKGKSWLNEDEATTCIALARQLFLSGKTKYRIITPYDPQRALIEAKLRASGMPWSDKVFCVDSFQGNEAPYIIISVVRTGNSPGFMKNTRRTNVMLSRCTTGMYIVSSKMFLGRPRVGKTLVGKMAKEWGKEAWLSTTDIVNSRI